MSGVSDAVREAIVELARRGRRGDLAAEAKRLSVDREDRAEKARVARLTGGFIQA